MPHAGPRRTIPPPAERPAPTRRWPLQVLAGAAVIGGIFLVMRWLGNGGDAADGVPTAGSTRPAAVEAPGEMRSSVERPPAASPEAPDARFLARLQRNSARRLLRDLPLSPDVADLVAAAQLQQAAALLEGRSSDGDRNATVVLTQLQLLCESPDAVRRQAGEPAPMAGSLDSELARSAPVPADLRRRIEASVQADAEARTRLERSCRDTRFNASAIEQRLRRAAEAGHEASLWTLGRYFDDSEQRNRHWLSAAMLGYPAAQASLAEQLLEESLQGDRRNRGRMNFWLDAAAKHSPQVKAKLGECILNGCNAQPPDSGAAVSLLREATLLGELAAFDALASVSRSEPLAPSEEELYGLQAFLQRLNETGCYGATTYPVAALKSLRSLREIGRGLSPHALQDAEQLGAARWHNHGAAARRAQHCE
ncbi:MAG TPA: hypothetical protein VJ764_07815 [Steroidobacteraceae bacterium]|nr:hypothetical protein [Steroidobacteraceae bacterium]